MEKKEKDTLKTFREEIETHCGVQLDARSVLLTTEGCSQAAIRRSVEACELYQDLKAQKARFVGVYDPKNAKVCEDSEGEAFTQREPPIDEPHFTKFLDLADHLMQDDSDITYIFAGRHTKGDKVILEKIQNLRWNWKVFALVYDAQLFEKHYWRNCSGLGNAVTTENLYLCWKGEQPTNMPKERRYVAKGSKLYNDTLLKVPVPHPKELTYVSKTLRDTSLTTMPAGPPPGTAAAADASDLLHGPSRDELKGSVKKRKLYRQYTGEDIVWFPWDNSPELLKELVWEAGGPERVKWILHGTPAGGTGLIGPIVSGRNVIALCHDAHHKQHLRTALVQKVVETTLDGKTTIFGNAGMLERARKLHLLKNEDDKEKKDKKRKNKDKEENEKEKKDRKSKRRKKETSDDEGSSSAPSSDAPLA